MSSRRPPPSITISLLTLALVVLASSAEADADAFGQCARQRDLDKKIAACVEASKSTPYPWILHWVYRELARAHRERGDSEGAIATYRRSLAIENRKLVRREMKEFISFTQAAGPDPVAPSPAASEFCTGCFAYLEFSSSLEPESYAMRGDAATSQPAQTRRTVTTTSKRRIWLPISEQ